MSSRRVARLNELLKREIARVLRREVHDPRVGLVTVTGVEVTGDLALARVYVRPGGGEEKDWESMMEGLEAASPYVRRELAQDLHLRRVPELQFLEDRTLEKAMRIERILDDVLPDGSEEEDDDGRGESESSPSPRAE